MANTRSKTEQKVEATQVIMSMNIYFRVRNSDFLIWILDVLLVYHDFGISHESSTGGVIRCLDLRKSLWGKKDQVFIFLSNTLSRSEAQSKGSGHQGLMVSHLFLGKYRIKECLVYASSLFLPLRISYMTGYPASTSQSISVLNWASLYLAQGAWSISPFNGSSPDSLPLENR